MIEPRARNYLRDFAGAEHCRDDRDGRQLAGLGLPALLKPFSVEWDCQRETLLG
jgi:hypothetical protein